MANEQQITPLNDRVLVRVAPPDEKTPGGLFIPGNAKDNRLSTRATVLAVGLGKIAPKTGVRILPSVKPGDEVWLSPYSMNRLGGESSETCIVRDEDILAVITEDSAA